VVAPGAFLAVIAAAAAGGTLSAMLGARGVLVPSVVVEPCSAC